MREGNVDNRYMEFSLGGQHYALPLLNVKEVIPKPEITTVPNMPAHFEGMINLRGQILGVFNVRKKLGTKPKVESGKVQDVVIVVENEGVSAGMIVDEVTRVIHATPDIIGPAPLKASDPARQYIVSVIRAEEELIMTLQVAQLLEFESLKKLNAA